MADEWVWGLHAVLAVLRTRPQDAHALHLADTRQAGVQDLLERARMAGVRVVNEQRQAFDERFPDSNHQGIALQCAPAEPLPESALEDLVAATASPLVLVLDGVTDPHNLGACLRTAEVAGVTAVVIMKDRAVGLTPVVRKVSSGASERLPVVQVTNLARTLEKLKASGLWVIGLAGEAAQDIYASDLTGPRVVVMGAEGRGLRRLTRDTCDFLASIPMCGDTGSLNVSVATGVVLFEALRQRSRAGRPA